MASRLRRIAVCTFAGVLHYSGFFRMRTFFRRAFLGEQEVCVLGLHRVLSGEQAARANSLPGITLRETTFEGMLEFIGRRFRVVGLDDFLQKAPGPFRKSKPLCLLTFDYGWKDNYTTAFPLLKKLELRAVIFLVTGMVGTDSVFWIEQLIGAWRDPARRQRILKEFEGLAGGANTNLEIEPIIEHLKHMPAKDRELSLTRILSDAAGSHNNEGDRMLSWDEVLAMQASGIEFEAHTVSHPLLVYEDDQSVQHELKGCKQTLEDKLAHKVRALAYPNGTWDERVRNAAQLAGYECAFTTQRGLHRQGRDPYTIRRIMLHEGNVTGLSGQFSPAMLSLRLSGWY